MMLRSFIPFLGIVLFLFSCKSTSPKKKTNGEVLKTEHVDLLDPSKEIIVPLSPGHFERVKLAFYNLENLFDTIDGPNDDAEYLPQSESKWNTERYQNKLRNMARVIDSLQPHILGVCEVENRLVLEDLKKHSRWLSASSAKIIHQESPDKRGIDVAFFYTPEWAFYDNEGVSSSEGSGPEKDKNELRGTFIEVNTGNNDKPTRNILAAEFLRRGVPFTVFVNHWPSRSGGEEKTRPLRFKAAEALKSYLTAHPEIEKWAAVGDFNDNPEDSSLLHILDVGHPQQFGVNLAYELRKLNPELGTGLYKDKWDMFDQIIVSKSLYHLGPNAPIPNIEIYKRDWLLQSEGKYKGHPFRTFGGKNYLNGYSDHLPVSAELFILMP